MLFSRKSKSLSIKSKRKLDAIGPFNQTDEEMHAVEINLKELHQLHQDMHDIVTDQFKNIDDVADAQNNTHQQTVKSSEVIQKAKKSRKYCCGCF